MKNKYLESLNVMTAEAFKRFNEKGGNDEIYKMMLTEIHEALKCLSLVTGKEYVINSDGTVTEREEVKK